jgi:hypothetical protein
MLLDNFFQLKVRSAKLLANYNEFGILEFVLLLEIQYNAKTKTLRELTHIYAANYELRSKTGMTNKPS